MFLQPQAFQLKGRIAKSKAKRPAYPLFCARYGFKVPVAYKNILLIFLIVLLGSKGICRRPILIAPRIGRRQSSAGIGISAQNICCCIAALHARMPHQEHGLGLIGKTSCFYGCANI